MERRFHFASVEPRLDAINLSGTCGILRLSGKRKKEGGGFLSFLPPREWL